MLSVKWLVLIISTILVQSAIFAQHKLTEAKKTDTIYYCNKSIQAIFFTDEKGLYHGPFQRFNSNNKLSSIKTYNHGLLNGPAVYFDEQEDTSVLITYRKNILNGPANYYYPGNRKMYTETYYAGKLKGSIIFQDTLGKPVDGVINGFFTKEGQNYLVTANCISGKPQSEVGVYNSDNGNLLKRLPYLNGVVNGKSYRYLGDKIISSSIYEKGAFVKEDDSNYEYHIFIYNNILDQEPDNDNFTLLRAIAYLRIGNVKRSLEDLDKTISLNKENYKAYYNRAVILADSLPKMAMKDLMQTLKIKKDFHIAYYNLGILYYRDGQYKKARDNFEACIAIMSNHLPSIHNLSMIYGLMGDKNMQDYYKNEFERIKKKNKTANR